MGPGKSKMSAGIESCSNGWIRKRWSVDDVTLVGGSIEQDTGPMNLEHFARNPSSNPEAKEVNSQLSLD
jgi:hypothetical protein